MKKLLFIFIYSLSSFSYCSDQETIQHLINRVKVSGNTFIRNDSNHTSLEAAEHLQGKWRRAKTLLWFKTRANEFTPQQFINKIASQSSYSGEAYRMILKTGEIITTKKWLLQELHKQKKLKKNKVNDQK